MTTKAKLTLQQGASDQALLGSVHFEEKSKSHISQSLYYKGDSGIECGSVVEWTHTWLSSLLAMGRKALFSVLIFSCPDCGLESQHGSSRVKWISA